MHSNQSLKTLALRLTPGMDLRDELQAIAKLEKFTAGFVMGAVGSLSKTCLRFAGKKELTTLAGKHEILSLSGMLGETGVHLHVAVANSEGQCFGGHLVQGCEVYTTLEIVIGIIPDLIFERTLDSLTGFKELDVRARDENEG